MKKEILILATVGLTACSTTGRIAEERAGLNKRVVIDNTYRGKDLPDWTRDGKTRWDDGKTVFIKTSYTVKGDQRVNACYDLAKFDLKENLITEISSEIKGEISSAMSGISENSEALVTKSFLQEFQANIQGLRVDEQLFERYLNGEMERIDCFVLGSVSTSDYQKLRQNMISKLAKENSELALALKNRQIEFFKKTDDTQKQPENVPKVSSESISSN